VSVYELIFLLAAAGVVVLAMLSAHFRGAFWVFAIVTDAVISDAWISAGWPLPDAFMAFADFCVCAGVYYLAAHRWELWLWLVMQTSMLVSLVHLGASIVAPNWIDQGDYLSVLEFCNYAAILLIGSITGFVAVHRKTGRAFGPWRRIRWLVHPSQREGAAGQ